MTGPIRWAVGLGLLGAAGLAAGCEAGAAPAPDAGSGPPAIATTGTGAPADPDAALPGLSARDAELIAGYPGFTRLAKPPSRGFAASATPTAGRGGFGRASRPAGSRSRTREARSS